ncbi:MAG: NusG domain II-containing protein [Clostridiaceae bacterium]|nr:NusG domain II-containing protein [Clostridiaceae bacterium]
MASRKRIMKWGDLVVAAVTVAIALGLWAWPALTAGTASPAALSAIVRTAAGKERSLSLDPETEPADIPIESGGYSYIIRVEPGRIRVLEADCPDRVCVVTGWLSRPGQIAACVPGRLLVRVVAVAETDPSGGVDVVSK